MQVTRRTFLHSAITATLSLAVVNNGGSVFGQEKVDDALYPIPVETYSHPLYSMTAKQFESMVGQTFSVTSADGSVRNMILSEVKPFERLGNTINGYYGEGFSLIFQNRKGKSRMTQDVYQLTGEGLPETFVLMVPVGQNQIEYEVILNRLTR